MMGDDDEDRSFLNRILDAYQGRITKKELQLLRKIVELGTESDDVRKYRLKLDFVRRVVLTLAYFALMYFIVRFLLGIYAPGLAHVSQF